MNVDVIGRIRPSLRGEGPHSIQIASNNRVYSHMGGVSHSFSILYKQDATNYEIYKRSVDSLVDLFANGYNTCLLCFGEGQSGKSYSIAGESVSKSGIVPIIIDQIYDRVSDAMRFDGNQRPSTQLSISMLECYNEKVKDLLQSPRGISEYLEVSENAIDGSYALGSKRIYSSSAVEATRAFRDGWSRRTQTLTDFGPSFNYAAIIIILELVISKGNMPTLNRSKFVIVEMPSAEKLSEDSTQLRMKEGPTLNKGLFAFGRLVAGLANAMQPDRVIDYNESVVTQLLKDEIGGNCKTRVLLNLRPHSDPHVMTTILRSATHMSQILNWPIENDVYAQGLTAQYRARILGLSAEQGLGPLESQSFVDDVREENKRLKADNLALRDKNERLYNKVENLHSKLNDLASAKKDLSTNYVMSEEEKLKVSKALVDLQIENNKVREFGEQSKFDLSNQVLLLENRLMEVDIEKGRAERVTEETKRTLAEVEQNRRQLADEYTLVKSNYLTLAKDYDREVARNEELSFELLHLVNTKEVIAKHRAALDDENGLLNSKTSHEIDRIRDLIARLATNRKSERLLVDDNERSKIERSILGDHERFKDSLTFIRRVHDEEQARLELLLKNLQDDLVDAKAKERDALRNNANVAVEALEAKATVKTLKAENASLKNKLKEQNIEYRNRLVRYVEDVAENVDSTRSTHDKNVKLKSYMEAMVRDIKRAHRNREEQLSDAVKQYKEEAKSASKKSGDLLGSYKYLRDQIVAIVEMVDLKLPEENIDVLKDNVELMTGREAGKLGQALQEVQNEIRNLKEKSLDSKQKRKYDKLKNRMQESGIDGMEVEAEKASLLARATVAEEQLAESQEYIDKHLAKYRDEILRLRKLLSRRTDDLTARADNILKPPNYNSSRYN